MIKLKVHEYNNGIMVDYYIELKNTSSVIEIDLVIV